MKTKLIAAISGLLLAGSAGAAELLASVEQVKGGATAIGLDIVSNGDVAGFSFAVEVGAVEAKAVRSGSCVAQLPKGFSAQCSYTNGKLFVYAVADAPGTYLPSGVASVGTVVVASPLAKAGAVRISGFETSNDNGVSTPGIAKVDGVDMGDMAAEPVAK
jgi:hypothetical protein